MTMKSLIVSAVLASGWAWCGGARGQVVFREAFDNYGLSMPGQTECCEIAEWPPSLKHLEFRPTKNESVYKGGFKLPKEAQGLTDYEVEFLVRFMKDKPKSIDIRLECLMDSAARQPKYSTCQLRISEDSSGVTAAGSLAPKLAPTKTPMKETALYPLIGGSFYRCLVRVQGKKLEAFLEGDGKTLRIGGAEVGNWPLAGFNFGGAAPFDLDDIIVRRIAGPGTDEFRDDGGAKVANRAAEYKLAFPLEANTASAEARIGHPGEMRIVLNWGDGSSTPISVSTFSSAFQKPAIRSAAPAEPKQVREPVALADAGLNFREITAKRSRQDWAITCNIRPWIDGYLDKDKTGVAARWEQYEAASKHFFKFEVRRDGKGIEYWIDGRYAGRHDSETPLREIAFVLPADGAVKDAAVASIDRGAAYLPLDVTPIANPGAMSSASLPAGTGPAVIKGIPFIVAPGAGNLDLGVARENFGTWALECDFYLSRTAFSGMPETLMLSVPSAQYHKAYLLCAVADDASKEPVLTARLTRFVSTSAGGRGPAIADTTVTLPRAGEAAAPPGVTKLGEIEYTERGKPHKAPLYLVEARLDCGKIQDVIFQETFYSMMPQPYLDFEVLGPTDRALQQLNKEHKPHPTLRSGVHVFGVTLERSPVEMEITPGRVGNAYTTAEQPSMSIVLRARGKSACRAAWEIADVDGRVIDSGDQRVSFEEAGTRTIALTPRTPGVGHYRAKFRLLDGRGEALVEHQASLAIVAPDGRKAGYESPYFSWWFHGAHLTCGDVNVVGPLLKMAGIRRTLVKSEAEGEPWKLTTGHIGNFTGRMTPEELESRRAEYARKMEERVKAFPSANGANIFHESCNGEFPLELYGIEMPLPSDEKQAAAQKAMVAGATLTAGMYREKYPQIRPTLVNSGDSLGGAGMLMRNRIPREALTALGEESLGQTMPPEMSTAWNFWALSELSKKMGYGGVPVDACYEWKGRGTRDLGERKVAAWRLRDALIAHAWGCRLVPMSGTIEPGNSYYNSVWGHDYMFSRSPQHYPYMSFVTTAHLTALLDGAAFSRQVETGSLSVYAVEFKRGDRFVHALWTARGTAQAAIRFEREGAIERTDMFGRPTAAEMKGGALEAAISTEPSYLVSAAPIASIGVGRRAYPEDAPAMWAKIQVADRMDAVEGWQVEPKADDRLENMPKLGNKNYLPFRHVGKYELRPARDEEKGPCLELELAQQGEIVPFIPEYAMLRLKNPVAVAGSPTTIGVWVKGNSGWGQIMWEFEDADGERWLSCGTGGYGCDIYDWPKQASINFDGWCFVRFPIVQASAVRVPGPGEVSQQWRTMGGGNRRIDYPIKLTGICVNMTRQALDLREMKPVKTVVRLRDLSVEE